MKIIPIMILVTCLFGHNSATEKQYCKILSKDSNDTGSLCDYEFIPDPSNILSFKNCVLYTKNNKGSSSFSGNISTLNTCTYYVGRYSQRKHILFEMLNFIPHQGLFDNYNGADTIADRSRIDYDFDLKQLTSKVEQQAKLFRDIDILNITKVRISDSTIDDYVPVKQWMKHNFHNMKKFELIRFRAQKVMEQMFLYSYEFKELEKINITDSVLPGLAFGSIHLYSNSFKELIIDNVDFSKKKIKSGGIQIERFYDYCSIPRTNISITIKNSNLGPSNLERDFINITDHCIGKGLPTQTMYITLTMMGNVFEHVLGEEQFGGFVKHFWSEPSYSVLSMQFEPIECCLHDNEWIIGLQSNNTKSKRKQKSKFFIDCEDLGTPISVYSNISSYTEICERRNVYPILIIAVVIISVLAIILAVLSCVCIFYVLPKKGQALVTHQHGNKKKSKLNMSKDGSKQTRKSIVHASKIDSIRTTLTDANTPASKQPLLKSISGRASEELAPAKKSTERLAQKSQVKKSPLPRYHFALPGLRKVRGKVLLEKRQPGALHKQ